MAWKKTWEPNESLRAILSGESEYNGWMDILVLDAPGENPKSYKILYVDGPYSVEVEYMYDKMYDRSKIIERTESARKELNRLKSENGRN